VKSGNGNENCGHCLKLFSEVDNAVTCDICDTWFHSRCQGVTEIIFKALTQHSKELFWFCANCHQGAEKLFPTLSKVQSKVNKLEDEIARLNTELKIELTRTITALVELKTEIVGFGSRIEQCEKKVEENMDLSVQSV